jgi:hypothetical protein
VDFDHLADAVVVFLNTFLKHPLGVASVELAPPPCWASRSSARSACLGARCADPPGWGFEPLQLPEPQKVETIRPRALAYRSRSTFP